LNIKIKTNTHEHQSETVHVPFCAQKEFESVKNITERDNVGTNAMLIFHGLFVQPCAWHYL